MEEINQQIVDFERKVSLLSANEIYPEDEKKKETNLPPVDRYNLLHVIFFVLSFGSLIPMSFFLTANDYWMYKFRDLSKDTYDPRNRTTLQRNFLSSSSVVQSLPNIVTNILSSMYGHKINIRKRFLGTLSVITFFFLTYTVFVEVDTDSWQLEFFILTMIVSFLKSVAGTLFAMSNVAMTSRFPPIYMKTVMYGSVAAMLFSSILQIICLWIGGTSTEVAEIYFYIGSVIIVATLVIAYFTKYNALFNFYLGDTVADTRRPLPSLAEVKKVYSRIKPLIWTAILGSFPMGMASGGITTMVVSEYYVKGDPWTDKYFTPVICFLIPGVVGLFARMLARPILTPDNVKWYVIASLSHSYIISPLYLFFNSSKKHLPVLFPHDWEYITIQVVNALIGGYLSTVSFLSMPRLAGDATELAFLTMTTLMMLLMSALSPLNSLWVNII
ncbi:unnamed protein product [Phaedon cochleariae]|uniref:Uncharacterized protein n=1 Tax=Phaedon cochleariae TaxID=80249 RepID=A0A9P0DUX5_PHACE|nr:unnamed protein product [Phaedon cochleariae]